MPTGQHRTLELQESLQLINNVYAVIRPIQNKIYESEEAIEFRIKENDTIYFDPKLNVIKVHFEHYYDRKRQGSKDFRQANPPNFEEDSSQCTIKVIKLKFRIPCNAQFRLFLRKIATSSFIKVQALEFDSFLPDNDAEVRR
jgi:hypothetical protein